MSDSDSGSLDHEEQLGLLAEELQAALAAGEHLSAEALARRYGVGEEEVVQLILAVSVLQESLDEDVGNELHAPDLPEDYEVGPELGRGGMGIVYRAHQKSLDRDVAVKVLRPGDLQFGDAIARFENEARSLARLRHRHIVSVHEVGKASGFVYFTMDLIDGLSLQQLIAGGQITNGRAVKLLRQVGSAMTYAHGQGVVHRDLKPANILVDHNDDAFVVDFGLARDIAGTTDATLSGQMMGTPAYMSPEQALGDRDKIGESADIYALGAILYECLTGKRPFEGLPLAQLMHAVIHEEPAPPRKLNPRIPADLEVICQTAMQKRIEDRYATVLGMTEDLERFSIGREILARRRSRTSQVIRFLRRNRKPLLAAVLPAVLIVVLGWMFLLPSMLIRRDIALGDRLQVEGNDAGAVMAYRSALTGVDQEDLALSVRARMAHSLVNEAGTWLLAGRGATEIDPLLEEAQELLPPVHAVPISAGALVRNDIEYEHMRLGAMCDTFVNYRYSFAPMQVRARRDLAGPGRSATLCMLAMFMAANGSSPIEFDEPACDAIVEIVRRRNRLPKSIRERFEGTVLSSFSSSLFEHPYSEYLQARLIDLVRDEGQPMLARKDAAALFHAAGTLPFATRFRRKSGERFRVEIPAVNAVELAELVAAWDDLQGCSRAESYRKQVAFVARRRFLDRAEAMAPLVTRDQHLMQFLRQRTGRSAHDKDEWSRWWSINAERDPRLWLLEALRWDIEPDALTPAGIVARFRDPPAQQVANQSHLLHHLLTLTVDTDLELPIAAADRSTQLQWEQLLNAVPEARHNLRIATLVFLNGNPKPRILWQTQAELSIHEKFSWRQRITQDLGLEDMHIGIPRVRWMSDLGNHMEVRGTAALKWTRDGMQCEVSSRFRRVVPTYHINGIYPSASEAAIGQLLCDSASLHYPRNGQTFIEVVTLSVTEPRGAPTTDWSIEQWRQALGEQLTAELGSRTQALGIMTAIGFLPQPEHPQAIARLDQALRETWKEHAGDFGRCARLLAGDIDALTQSAIADGEGTSHPSSSPSFWVRLALSSNPGPIRDHAFEQLRSEPLLPAFRRTLQNAMQNGTQVPEWLAQQLRSEPGATWSYLSSAPWMVVFLLGTIFTMVASAVVALRARSPAKTRRCAAILWLTSLVFANYSIWIKATEWNSPWIGHSINVIATWMVCWRLLPHWSWLLAPTAWSMVTALDLLRLAKGDRLHISYGVAAGLLILLWWQYQRRQWRNRRLSIRTRSIAAG